MATSSNILSDFIRAGVCLVVVTQRVRLLHGQLKLRTFHVFKFSVTVFFCFFFHFTALNCKFVLKFHFVWFKHGDGSFILSLSSNSVVRTPLDVTG